MASLAECAAHLCMTSENFREYVVKGIVKKQDHAAYDLNVVRKEYIMYMRAAASGRGTPEGQLGLTEERAKLTKTQREAQEMKNAVARGELVLIEAVGQLVEECFGNVRNRLVTIPGKLSAALAEQTRDQIEARLVIELNEILAELHSPDTIVAKVVAGGGQLDESGAGSEPSGASPQGGASLPTVADAQPRRVGRPKKAAA